MNPSSDEPRGSLRWPRWLGRPQPRRTSPAASAGPVPAGQDQDGGTGGGIGLALAHAGECSEAHLTCPGADRLIATRQERHPVARAADSWPIAWGGPAIQLSSADRHRPAIRQRLQIAETPHGHIKHNMGLRQLSVRGKRKASAEWEFICAVHNLFKALRTCDLIVVSAPGQHQAD